MLKRNSSGVFEHIMSSKILKRKTPSNVSRNCWLPLQADDDDTEEMESGNTVALYGFTRATIDELKAALIAHNFECNDAEIIVKIMIIGRIQLTSPILRTVRKKYLGGEF
uniref:Uncharacterized protein n=1 Tax=Glossina austeni TaxID=7395 RepID=A0A1A9UWF2_GLOAU